jgi:hypothetical protein
MIIFDFNSVEQRINDNWYYLRFHVKPELIKEHINFERGLDPKDAMRIGNRIRKGDMFPIKKYHPGTREWVDYVVTATSDEENGRLPDPLKRFVSVETPSGNDWFATFDEEKGVWI